MEFDWKTPVGERGQSKGVNSRPLVQRRLIGASEKLKYELLTAYSLCFSLCFPHFDLTGLKILTLLGYTDPFMNMQSQSHLPKSLLRKID
jgi:hypothetical protein